MCRSIARHLYGSVRHIKETATPNGVAVSFYMAYFRSGFMSKLRLSGEST
jgi:hypothetical protein